MIQIYEVSTKTHSTFYDDIINKNFSLFIGKTCLVRRFTQGVFPPGQGATIGVDFMIKTVVVDNEKIKVSRFCLLNF